LRRHEFREFKEKEIKRKDPEVRLDNGIMHFRDRLCDGYHRTEEEVLDGIHEKSIRLLPPFIDSRVEVEGGNRKTLYEMW
jgi:hypothetical protein